MKVRSAKKQRRTEWKLVAGRRKGTLKNTDSDLKGEMEGRSTGSVVVVVTTVRSATMTTMKTTIVIRFYVINSMLPTLCPGRCVPSSPLPVFRFDKRTGLHCRIPFLLYAPVENPFIIAPSPPILCCAVAGWMSVQSSGNAAAWWRMVVYCFVAGQ